MAGSDKGIGHNKAPGTILVLWGLVTPYKGFIHNHSQVIAVRLLLGALKTGVSPGFAHSFTAISFFSFEESYSSENYAGQIDECS